MNEQERFWSKARKGPGCWEWTAARDKDGYGMFAKEHRKQVRAHRYAFELLGHEIPGGSIVMHTCDNPSCVRPDHLRIGTHRENTQDAIRKGRQRPRESGRHFNRARGERHHKAVLTEAQVRTIRRSEISYRMLARILGVNKSTVARAARGMSWSHLEEER